MSRFMAILAGLYQRWKYVEDDSTPEPETGRSAPADERRRLEEALAREERMIEHFRRQRCAEMVREREATLRILQARLMALGERGLSA